MPICLAFGIPVPGSYNLEEINLKQAPVFLVFQPIASVSFLFLFLFFFFFKTNCMLAEA